METVFRVVTLRYEKASTDVLSVVTFAVVAFMVVTFMSAAWILVVERAFETHRFPWILRAFPKGDVPTPMFEVAMSVVAFAVVLTFTKFKPVIFVVVTELDTYTFPWTLRAFPKGTVPMPMFDETRVRVFAVPETFADVEATLVVVIVFDTYTFP
jgi:hypothetical protein